MKKKKKKYMYFPRGVSAVGSASHWQCGGQGFESPTLHFERLLFKVLKGALAIAFSL